MLHFNPDDPYPLAPPGTWSYAQEQAHARQVDQWLGLECERVEIEIARSSSQGGQSGSQLWVGLGVQALLTPYTELRAILHELSPAPGQFVVDLGAGYGRMGFVIARHHPGVRFVGYEISSARVAAGERALGIRAGIELLAQDLATPAFTPVEAEFYFIYDYGSRQDIAKTLTDLRAIAARAANQGRAITVVGRGRATRDAIERQEPWLSQVVTPRHRGRFSIYSTLTIV